jgi:hypothetical protein
VGFIKCLSLFPVRIWGWAEDDPSAEQLDPPRATLGLLSAGCGERGAHADADYNAKLNRIGPHLA